MNTDLFTRFLKIENFIFELRNRIDANGEGCILDRVFRLLSTCDVLMLVFDNSSIERVLDQIEDCKDSMKFICDHK